MRLIKVLFLVGGFVASMGANAADGGLGSGISRLSEKKQALMEIVMDRESVIQQILSRPFLPPEGPLSDFAELEIMLRTVSDDRLADALLAEDFTALQAALVPSQPSIQANVVGPQFIGSFSADLVFTPIEPCRFFDTRLDSRGLMMADETRVFAVNGSTVSDQGGSNSDCPNVPANPVAIVFTLTAANPQGSGNVRVWRFNDPQPIVSNLNFRTGVNIANTTVTPVCLGCGIEDINIRVSLSQAQILGDIIGYFRFPLNCRGGTTKFNNLCFETALRAQDDLTDALEICGSAGGRLPSVAELFPALSVLTGNNVTGEHTDNMHADAGSDVFRNTRLKDDTLGPDPENAGVLVQAPYRCVFDLF